jgi:hypothetical protein
MQPMDATRLKLLAAAMQALDRVVRREIRTFPAECIRCELQPDSATTSWLWVRRLDNFVQSSG